MTVFALYALALLVLGLADARRSGSAEAFFVNNRSSGPTAVALSVLASCVGGSATLGMAGLAWSVGAPAFWWLGSGACGLAVLTLLLARKVRAAGTYTMPELVSRRLGPLAARLISLVILLAWPAILAAQFVAVGRITVQLTGLEAETALLLSAGVLTCYATLGGQASVIRSDAGQFVALLAGLLLGLLLLGMRNPEPLRLMEWQWLNADFPASRLGSWLVILGGSYVVCPMLFGRFLSARDSEAALRGGWAACLGLALTAVLIVLLGVACRGLVPPDTPPDGVLPAALALLPAWAATAVLLALFSAMISSADSCLITASTVCCNDLLRTRSVSVCRLATLCIAWAGLLLAGAGHGILELLLMANDVYVCGVVAPVFVGLVLSPARSVRPGWGAAAVLVGGSLGLCSAFSGQTLFSYAGVAASAGLTLWGAYGTVRRKGESVSDDCFSQ